MNNELIKQRLSCIPIHLKIDKDFLHENYQLEIDIQNDTNLNMYVTTKDFKIKNKTLDTYLSTAEVRKIFPPNALTGSYIDFIRLRPKLSEDIAGEALKLTCGFDIGKSNEDAAFNVVSTCAYGNTIDKVEAQKKWSEREKELKGTEMTKEELELVKKNWFLLEGQKYNIPNSFDFIIETVGVYTNQEIIQIACEIMKDKLQTFAEKIQSDISIVEKAIASKDTHRASTMMNAYNIILENEKLYIG